MTPCLYLVATLWLLIIFKLSVCFPSQLLFRHAQIYCSALRLFTPKVYDASHKLNILLYKGRVFPPEKNITKRTVAGGQIPSGVRFKLKITHPVDYRNE